MQPSAWRCPNSFRCSQRQYLALAGRRAAVQTDAGVPELPAQARDQVQRLRVVGHDDNAVLRGGPVNTTARCVTCTALAALPASRGSASVPKCPKHSTQNLKLAGHFRKGALLPAPYNRNSKCKRHEDARASNQVPPCAALVVVTAPMKIRGKVRRQLLKAVLAASLLAGKWQNEAINAMNRGKQRWARA